MTAFLTERESAIDRKSNHKKITEEIIMLNKDIFSMTKAYYETALDNFELYQKNSEKMMRIFMDQHGDMNNDFMKHYDEWIASSQKGFNDYRKLVLDGLDYLADTFEK